jgi:hypothetical protein
MSHIFGTPFDEYSLRTQLVEISSNAPDYYGPLNHRSYLMRTVKFIVCATMLALAVSTPTVAKPGTISGIKSGTISGTHSGTISGTHSGTISGTRSGTISEGGIIPTAPTAQVDSIRFRLFELLVDLKVW